MLYDAATGRPNSIAHSFGASTLASFGYGFDTDGKILSIADSGGARSFTYDATQQVTGGGYAGAPESYAYDPEGNRTTSHLSASYIHDAANRLRENDDACYEYDANGNLATRTARIGLAGCIGDVTTYEWDVLNRLVRIDNPDATYAAYRYDAQGRRIEKDVNGALTRYVYDGDAILLEYDGANALLARYSHGEEIDQPLAMTRGADSYFYHTDHLGSVRLLTNASGAVANAYDYDAFGNLEATSFEAVANPYTFTAREYDAESGLMFYRARYYDPRIGRFVSEDPIGFKASDLNLYRYVFNEAINLVDPTGKTALAEYGGRSIAATGRRVNDIRLLHSALLSAAIKAGLVTGGIASGAVLIKIGDACAALNAFVHGFVGGAVGAAGGVASGAFAGALSFLFLDISCQISSVNDYIEEFDPSTTFA